MQHAEVLAAIRRLVRDIFQELGAEPPVTFSEHILIRDDIYCGRRFQAGDLQAIWFVEEDEVKVYAQEGSVVRVMSASSAVHASAAECQRAA